jgi:ABC-type nitrate/sulfonate/bicarbonate transport system substrate-binding protein
VLIIGKSWVDADPARARRFMQAYFEALSWVKANTDAATEIVQGAYIEQELDVIRENMDKFVWHDAEAQRTVMSDAGIFGQADYVVRILHEDMKTIPEKPAFRDWVRMDILPSEG